MKDQCSRHSHTYTWGESGERVMRCSNKRKRVDNINNTRGERGESLWGVLTKKKRREEGKYASIFWDSFTCDYL